MDIEAEAKRALHSDVQPAPDRLVAILEAASDLFHNGEEESFLTDHEFDALERMLSSMDPRNSYFLTVGSDVRGGKVKLPDPMGSLDQLYEGDTQRWVQGNGWLDEDFVLSDKLDGTSGSIYYDARGTLKVAYSRGNGTMGADITRHVKRMPGVPQRVSTDIATRNEFIMRKATFTEVQGQIAARSGRTYKNPRNFVAGKMNASESEDLFYTSISVVVTSVLNPKLGKVAQLERCRKEGMEVNYYTVVKGRDLNDEFLTAYLNERRAASPYELDGIVVDLDSAAIRASLRRKNTSLNPMYSRKFKVGGEDNKAQTRVTQVLWRVSKAGYLKPRVEIEPVDLVGVTITYATGFNAKFIKDRGIGPGALIEITRAGDVIPYIQNVVSPASGGAQLPTEEEFGAMKWTDGDVDMLLVDPSGNADSNLYRIIDIFKHWDVPFLRQGSIEKLIDAKLDTAELIILASRQQLQDAVGDSAGGKIYDGLRSKLNPITLPSLVGGSQTLGRGVGTRKMTKLCEALNLTTVDQLAELCGSADAINRISAVDGFERKTAEVIVRNMPRFLAFADHIQAHFTLEAPKAKVVGGALSSVIAVFTGVRDKDLEQRIADAGGTVASSVNKATTHLVCKDPSANSSKLQKARDLGVTIISLEDARTLWA